MIEARGLSKRYGSRLAVDNLTFDVQPGVVTGFLGPNGSGKSTTMRLLLGLDRPTSGSATFEGKPYTSYAQPLREVGALLDAGYAHPTRTARAHLSALAASNGLPSTRVGEVLSMVGLAEVARKRVGTFSLGMKQRLGIAAAMLGDPRTLLFDEPANGLDPEGMRWIREFLRALAAQGRTVFVSSHLLGEVSLMADRLIVIGQGRLMSDSTVDEFVARFAKSWVRVESPSMAHFAQLLSARGATLQFESPNVAQVHGLSAREIGAIAAASSTELHQLANQTGSLEEAYLQVTHAATEYRGSPG